MARWLLTAAVAIGLGAGGVVPAWAQTTQGRPYRGLFGGGTGDADQVLTLSASVGAGYATDVFIGNALTDQSASTGALQNTKTSFEQASTGLTYTFSRPNMNIGATGSISGLNFVGEHTPVLTSETGGVGATFKLSSRTTLTGGTTVTYSPFYSLTPVLDFSTPSANPLPVNVPDFTNSIAAADHLSTVTGIGLTQSLSKRVTATLAYGYATSTSALLPSLDMNVQDALANLSVGLGKGFAFSLGYMFTESTFGPPSSRQHTISNGFAGTGGFNFSRALSLTRRLRLTFSTGIAGATDGRQTSYGLVGNVALIREIGRTWTATIGYNRSIGFSELFTHPVFSDAVSGTFGGLLTRRLQLQNTFSINWGGVGIGEANNGFSTYSASSGLTYGLTTNLGLGVAYAWYRYNFGSGIALPNGLAQRADDQTARVFVTLWEPLFERRGKK